MTKVSEMKPGQTAEIDGYRMGHAAYRAKLLALGLTRGVRLTMVNVAPLGDPVELEVRGFHLSLRRDEAEILKIRQPGGEREFLGNATK
jgi:ferrous iron transport protein A